MVFQRPNPLPLSVYENVVFGLRVHDARASSRGRRSTRRSRSALTRGGAVGRPQGPARRARRRALQLEQQQKLCIARLLPLKPEVILMDEPCSALDVEGTRAIEELMWTLRGRYTIVIVTHNMAQARRASDECIFMLLGEIIEHRRTEDLFLNPARAAHGRVHRRPLRLRREAPSVSHSQTYGFVASHSSSFHLPAGSAMMNVQCS